MSNAVMSATRPRAVAAMNVAGFWIRFCAFVTDWLILIAMSIVLSIATYVGLRFVVDANYLKSTYADVSRYVLFVAHMSYYLYFWGSKGATPGKRLLGLQVLVPGELGSTGIGQGRAFIRMIGYTIDTLTLGLGVLVMFGNPERRALHDYIAGTVVVRKQ